MAYFCINNAYVCACYLLCPLPGTALITWWLPWQRFIETFTKVSKPNIHVSCCLEWCVYHIWIHVPLRKHIYVSMFHNEMLSTGRLYVDEMLNECLLNAFTVLLICSSMKRCGIRSPHTIKYCMLHAIEMYLIVFMMNKSLSKSKSKSKSQRWQGSSQSMLLVSLIARFLGPTWDPFGAGRTQVGPMLTPWTLLSGCFIYYQRRVANYFFVFTLISVAEFYNFKPTTTKLIPYICLATTIQSQLVCSLVIVMNAYLIPCFYAINKISTLSVAWENITFKLLVLLRRSYNSALSSFLYLINPIWRKISRGEKSQHTSSRYDITPGHSRLWNVKYRCVLHIIWVELYNGSHVLPLGG